MNLADVLGDKPIERPAIVDEPATDEKPAEQAAATPSVATEAKEPEKAPETSTQRDEQGRFVKKEADKQAEKPEPMVPLSALLAERAKRRTDEKPKTSIFEDEDKGVAERVDHAVSPLEEKVFSLELKLARKEHSDFDEAMMAFLKDAQNDPVLKHQADTSPDPLTFMYREGKRRMELAEVDGDITKYREKVLSEANAKLSEKDARIQALEAELSALKASQGKAAKIPQSLNTEQSAAPSQDAFAGPRPIKSILS